MRRAVTHACRWAGATAAAAGGRGGGCTTTASGSLAAGGERAAAEAAGRLKRPGRGFAAQPAAEEAGASTSGRPPAPPPPPPPEPPGGPSPQSSQGPPSSPASVHDRLVFNLYMLRARAHARGLPRPRRAPPPGTEAVGPAAGELTSSSAAASTPPAPAAADAMLFAPLRALLDGFSPGGGGSASSATAAPTSTPASTSFFDQDPDRVLELWARQLDLERSGLDAARERYEADMAASVAANVAADYGPALSLMSEMYGGAVAAIRREQLAVAADEPGVDRRKMGPRLLLLDAETLAVIALHTLIKGVLVPRAARGSSGPSVSGRVAGGGPPGPGGVAVDAGGPDFARGRAAAAASRGVATPVSYASLGGAPSPLVDAAPPLEAEGGDLLRGAEGGDAASAAAAAARPDTAPFTHPRAEPRLEARFTSVALAIGRNVATQVQLERLREAVRKERAVRAGMAAAFEEASAKAARRARGAQRGGGGGAPAAGAAAVVGEGLSPEEEAALLARFRAMTEEKGWGASRRAGTPSSLRGSAPGGAAGPKGPDPGTDLGRRLRRLEKELAARGRPQHSRLTRSTVAVRALKSLDAVPEWTPADHVKMGAVLVKALIEGCTLTPSHPPHHPPHPPPPAEGGGGRRGRRPAPEPAFAHFDRQWRGARVGVLRAHDEIGRRAMGRSGLLAAAATPAYQPMLVPPLPWRSSNEGGHLILRSLVVRPPRHPGAAAELRSALRAADAKPPVGLGRVYGALNALGAVPWRVNAPVLAAVEAAWAGGGGAAGLVPRDDMPRTPPPPPLYVRRPWLSGGGGTAPALVAGGETSLERRFRYAANHWATKVNKERHSLRCDTELKLGVARRYAGEAAFYYPHNLDFRGRAYPMHPHLNHLGSDLCRGLLEFADPRPLGPDGYDWLLVQVANAWGAGADKLSFEGRRAFAQERMADIVASAADPAGCDWWTGGEDPWQLLATCMEVAAADATGDPASFPSRLPVRIDGSCNGLQHYAALGRDAEGGAAVNLVPGGAPRDVYAGVADVVARRVARDAATPGGPPAAAALVGEVDRKLVKQTVMTSVYGVTFVGARGQVMDRLRERGWVAAQGNSPAGVDHIFDVSNYGARVTLEGLRELFSSARAIQGWLATVAGLVARTGSPVTWTTPLGLPVTQPYRRERAHAVRTVLQRLVLASGDTSSPVSVQRQRAAFPPNFIHALDSTHMMMTASAAARAGLCFAGVHDSFWTHAGTVGQLSAILRDQFVDLHSRPLLEDLAAELAKAHPGVELPPLPAQGSLDLEQVRDSPYFFS